MAWRRADWRVLKVTSPPTSASSDTIDRATAAEIPREQAPAAQQRRAAGDAEQVARGRGIHHGDAGQVDDGELGTPSGDGIEQHLVQAGGVLTADLTDHGQHDHSVPDLDDGGRECAQILFPKLLREARSLPGRLQRCDARIRGRGHRRRAQR